MKKIIICIVFCCFAIVLEIQFSFAQTIDFNNFTYRLSKDAQNQLETNKNIKVVNGKFSNKEGGFGIDRTLNSNDFSVVVAEYGMHEINHPLNDVYVFRVSEKAELLKIITAEDLAKDGARWFNKDSILAMATDKINIKNDKISIPVFTDGPRCCPKNVALFVYRITGNTVSLVGRPVKEPFISIDKISNWPREI